jgi:hypothetical protein
VDNTLSDAGSLKNVPILLIFVGVTMIIGSIVFQNVVDALPALTGDANTAVEGMVTNMWAAFQLLGIGLIVIGAGGVLRYLGILG